MNLEPTKVDLWSAAPTCFIDCPEEDKRKYRKSTTEALHDSCFLELVSVFLQLSLYMHKLNLKQKTVVVKSGYMKPW